MVFRVFIFIILFRTNGKKRYFHENGIRHYDGILFERFILQVLLLQLYSKFLLNN